MTRALVLALWLSGTIVTPSQADDAVEASFFESRARDAERRGDVRRALESYLHASRLVGAPRLLFETARVAVRAGEEALAWTFYERYLALADGHAGEPEARLAEARAALARLEARGRFAVLEVRSEPLGARVYVDRAEYGLAGVTPCRIAVHPGPRILLLEHDDFHPTARSLEVSAGARSSVDEALRPRVGQLVVAAPADSRVTLRRVSGELRAPAMRATSTRRDEGRDDAAAEDPRSDAIEVDANTPIELPIGTYEVRAARVTTSPSRHVRVVEGATARVALIDAPAAPATGRLLVQSEPPATLFLDGVERARTPAALLELPTGEHQVELVTPGHRRWRRTLRIGEANTYLDVRLVPE